MRSALLVCVVLVMGMACSPGFPPEFPVPEFSLESPLTGTVVSREAILGRPTIIYWFASW